LIDQELADPCNIWIVCEESKMKNGENELASLTDEKKITSCTFKPMDPIKDRFLKEHCWGRIKEKENQKSCKAEGVAVLEIDSGSLEVKGTHAGRKEMIIFLQRLAGNVSFKVRMSFFQQKVGEMIE
jgi:activator of 2-hydroxyglutaryl-CoA dehydratase